MTLYIFDKDGTLVGGANGRPANKPSEQTPLSGVVEKVAELRAAGHKIAIASNQGGVSWGFISEAQAIELMRDAADKIGGAAWIFSPDHLKAPRGGNYDSIMRPGVAAPKPSPDMIIRLMNDFSSAPRDTIMIGDQESDSQAAEAAGVRFVWAKDFFGW